MPSLPGRYRLTISRRAVPRSTRLSSKIFCFTASPRVAGILNTMIYRAGANDFSHVCHCVVVDAVEYACVRRRKLFRLFKISP